MSQHAWPGTHGASRVWLSGSGRSGTTWFGHLLSGARATVINEPFNTRHVTLEPWAMQALARPLRPYVRPDADAPQWAALVDDLYAGRHANRWTRYGMRKWTRWPSVWWGRLRARRQVVKSIRSNLMTGWLARRDDLAVVHLVRHPCATVDSQRSRGWGDDIEVFLGDRQLLDDYLGPHEAMLRSDRLGEWERRAARWAIENLVPLRQAASENILVVTYESLVLDPQNALERVFSHLGWRLDRSERARVRRRIGDAMSGLKQVGSAETMLGQWRRRLAAADAEAILRTTRALGITLYDDQVTPRAS